VNGPAGSASFAGTAPRVVTHEGLSVGVGQQRGVAYAVVSDLPESRVRQVAELVAASERRW
jgi:hypothetical protein